VLACTTSVENSGLLAHILPLFTAATGIEVRVVAQGTGQALAMAARGDADLVLVHDPDAEATFMADHHGIERREIAWNDFILVGPASDPAHGGGGVALRAISAAHAPFVLGGDASGTSAKEKRLWRIAGIDPIHSDAGWCRDIGSGRAPEAGQAAIGGYTIAGQRPFHPAAEPPP